MLIRQITLNNFGLYRGSHAIALTPRVKYRQQRPVVLVGGQNGAGKTTILEALRLCLYGPLALGERIGRKEYERYLRDRIHRSLDSSSLSKGASVGLEFEHSAFGEIHVYSVERSWEVSGDTVHTFLEVKRDAQSLDEIDQANADEFLRDLIPPGVSQLYFFDGEKIQQLAEAEDDSDTLGDAIRGLLGLDLVDQLNIDLKIYARRLDDTQDTAPIKERLDQLATRKRQLKDRDSRLLRAADETQSRVDQIKVDLERAKQRVVREGGTYAKKQESLRAHREQLFESIRQSEEELRDLCCELLPFTLAGKLCSSLRDQLQAEHRVQSWKTHSALLSTRISEVSGSLDEHLFKSIRVGEKARDELRDRVNGILNDLSAMPDDLPDVPLVHRLSDDECERVLSAIEGVQTQLPKQISKIESRLENATRNLMKVEDQLHQIPAEDQLQPLLERLNDLNAQLLAAERDRESAFAELDKHDLELQAVDREAEKLDLELSSASKGMDRRAMVNSVQSVLAEYSTELASAKAAELTDAVASRFMQLWRKEQVIQRVEIDPKSYKVTLFDRHDRPVSKKELSAGEKQVYAVSMLWALAEVSGRPLPVVIDTPLGRLDSQHRFHLVEHYFPNASHQVIILSTDTEIDEEHFRELSPSISHAFQLRFDEAQGCTIVEEGYFWGRRKQELAHAIE